MIFFFFEEENLGVFFEKAASSFDGNIINSGMAGKSSQKIPRTSHQDLDFPVFGQKSTAELRSKEKNQGLVGPFAL